MPELSIQNIAAYWTITVTRIRSGVEDDIQMEGLIHEEDKT